MRILIVEDDERLAKNLAIIFTKEHFTVDSAKEGIKALELAEINSYDLILLDWMLPDLEGVAVCQTLREKQIAVPILMLTAKSQLEDKLTGFSQGADDYVTKPFLAAELVARAKALLRRSMPSGPSPLIQIGDLVIDTNTQRVSREGQLINLAPKEYALLEYLALHQCQAQDRMTLLEHVWGETVDEFSNTVDVHIRYLRSKIDTSPVKIIHTVKGKGYMLCGR